MGLTLIAVFTAALLLPGIIAARAFYFAGQTREVEVPVPSLSTPNSISLVGCFSVIVHAVYVLLLKLVIQLPPTIPLPLSDPYRPFVAVKGDNAIDLAWAFLSGLLLLSLLAALIGLMVGRAAIKWMDKSLIYGPIADVIESANGDDKFITAYVISKMSEGTRFVGYQGTVDSLFRDDDRFPTKVVLKDVVPFYLELGDDSPVRKEAKQVIDWLVMTADDWHNIAFRVFQLVDDSQEA
ncbi:MAG: hypothetical protein KKB67_09795 [Alphaproteobacteria bacterium]|uniref:DUF6338 family protein n=1 Tax=Sphingobium sp. TaxID=1912891 RepID=UPI000C6B8E3B|nr:DUF6338 family protein [Sphingobium sp.]MBU0658742.1 hypothetical protein [Alphaproteobacteria bacterium]MBS87866.1 hypothetical protein [Sphingobium sp.]MBU0775132.1 hypothetical protein [Alphaproteobacteria bacterium]MBU0867784.1 hypothetical protein [Alphaproteobacteria bacterium]MBU1257360.1 hypothetical protein [Alphaproteobacteria bacterium]